MGALSGCSAGDNPVANLGADKSVRDVVVDARYRRAARGDVGEQALLSGAGTRGHFRAIAGQVGEYVGTPRLLENGLQHHRLHAQAVGAKAVVAVARKGLE